MSYLTDICPFKLSETYDTLYELQQRLDISDDYLLSTIRDEVEDLRHHERLCNLLDASRTTRENLITWHMKQSLVELNVTISLLTAKIKFIEFKLGKCEGLDLHQACSLSLVNFCNILADMTVLNVEPSKRKTMHMISNQVDIPIWLSHYRNQICHVPSESPCISILVPLVVKSLDYMKDSFWSKVLERETFDGQKCKDLVRKLSRLTTIQSCNQNRMKLKKGIELSKRQLKLAKNNLSGAMKGCSKLRKLLTKNPQQVIEVMLTFMVAYQPKDESKNFALLLEQVIYTQCFERFVYKLLALAEERPGEKIIFSWLRRMITLIGSRRRETVRQTLRKMSLFVSAKTVRLTNITSIKCCQIAYRLSRLDNPKVNVLILRMRDKLTPVLGEERTNLLLELTKIAKGEQV